MSLQEYNSTSVGQMPHMPMNAGASMDGSNMQGQNVGGGMQMVLPGQSMNNGPQVMMPGQNNGFNQNMAANLGAAAVTANNAMPVSPTKESPTSTQSSLLISELRDNVAIMKDGSFRAVVACKSINFDLMSDAEREGVEYSYQNFLNSLKFTTQILIRSQKVDIGPYIERLSEIRRNNDNMLLGVLMDDYINFIDVLSQEANIMDKAFFVVVPYYTWQMRRKLWNKRGIFLKPLLRVRRQGW